MDQAILPLRRQAPSGRFSGPTRNPCFAFFGFLVSSTASPASGRASSSRGRLADMVGDRLGEWGMVLLQVDWRLLELFFGDSLAIRMRACYRGWAVSAPGPRPECPLMPR